ncbi:MAG TPA: 50S ribosomal protein L7/L12 [Candidatus Paceibacterota bacterium]
MSEKSEKIIKEVEEMSVLELNELVKAFEEKFGVSATAPTMAVEAPTGDVGAEERATLNIELSDGGDNKIAVIKVVKEVLGLGLKEAKDLVDAAPSMLKQDMKKEEAEDLKKKIEEAGGKVTLK